MGDPRKRIVRAGYDAIAERYLAWLAEIDGDPRDRFLDEFIARMPTGGRALDLGCGAALPSTRRMAERYEVVGVDISEEQVRLARANVPDATFIRGDCAKMEFDAGSFDGVTAFYSISHLPREEHADLLVRIANWLTPGGLLLATLGAHGSTGWTGDWLGMPMFFSAFGADANRRLLGEAGFTIVLDEVVAMREPEEEVEFLWVLARRSGS